MNLTARVAVLKFGGTSVATAEQRAIACARVRDARDAGFAVVAVVSAMGRAPEPYATDTLLVARRRTQRQCQRRSAPGRRRTHFGCGVRRHVVRSGSSGRRVERRAGGHRDRRPPRRRDDFARRTAGRQRVDRTWQRAGRRRFSRRRRKRRVDDAGTRRHRSLRRGYRTRARGRTRRHLHRCQRGDDRRSAAGPQRADDRARVVGGNDRAGQSRCQGDAFQSGVVCRSHRHALRGQRTWKPIAARSWTKASTIIVPSPASRRAAR